MYDGNGTLVKSTVNGVVTYYPSTSYQEEGGTITKYYSLGSQRVAMREGGVLSWLITDHLGSINVTASADGSLQSEMRYAAFGETRYTNGVTPSDYRYTGQLQQAELGLYFYSARWYDPQLGRFIQADSIVPGGGNTKAYDRYAYVFNNPINFNDPSGHNCSEDSSLPCPLMPGERAPAQSKANPDKRTVVYINPVASSTSGSSSGSNPNNNGTSGNLNNPTEISEKGIKFIAQFERSVPTPYEDSSKYCTVGIGHLMHLSACSPEERAAAPLTNSQILDLFRNDLVITEQQISKVVKVNLTQEQFDALVSFAYNIGPFEPNGFSDSQLLEDLNNGDYQLVPKEMRRWNKSGGEVSEGLVRRREFEIKLFATGEYDFGY